LQWCKGRLRRDLLLCPLLLVLLLLVLPVLPVSSKK
jgi:hypothetical protein